MFLPFQETTRDNSFISGQLPPCNTEMKQLDDSSIEAAFSHTPDNVVSLVVVIPLFPSGAGVSSRRSRNPWKTKKRQRYHRNAANGNLLLSLFGGTYRIVSNGGFYILSWTTCRLLLFRNVMLSARENRGIWCRHGGLNASLLCPVLSLFFVSGRSREGLILHLALGEMQALVLCFVSLKC